MQRRDTSLTAREASVYLIDHAWTCRPQQARQQLRDIPRLLHRMAQLMDLDETLDPDALVDAVFASMWRYNQTYSVCGPLTTTEDSVPVWYIMDEFGSRIQHCSESPSFRCVPFYYMAQRESYSVLYPVKDVACGEEATRNFAEGPPCDPLTRAALLLPWEPCDLTHVDCNQAEPSEEFLRSGRKEESLPDTSVAFGPVPTDRKLKVFSEYRYVNEHLTHPSFELTDDEREADILWYNYHFKNYGYIMDEFGSRIQHCSESPSFRCVPFYYMAQRESYSVLYPVKDVACGEEATRNFAEGPPCDPLTRAALLLPWEPCDLTHVDCNQAEPSEEFLRSGRKEESLPDTSVAFGPVPTDRKLKVFSEYRYVNEHLTHPSFELTDDEREADILWYNYHFKNYGELSREGGWKRVNQFPFEHVLTVKDLLALVCRRDAQGGPTVDPATLATLPAWLPTTYNLKTELPQFVSYFQQRQDR
ncbi:hypothetical protein ISCGN_018745 [Ixodes scapularis]